MRPIKLAVFGVVVFLAGVTAASAGGGSFEAPTPNPTPAAVVFPIRDFSSLRYIGNDSGFWNPLNESSFLRDLGFTVDGWLNGGLLDNTENPSEHFNGPVGYQDKDQGQLDQAYLSIARTAPKNDRDLFLGGRVDVFYGSDYYFATASGWDGSLDGNIPHWHTADYTYGWAFPQLYATAAFDGFELKAGHFYTILGHESVMAKSNFFLTHSYAFLYGEPWTDTGALLAKSFGGHWTLTGGIVNSWNQVAGNLSNGGANASNFLGSLAYADSGFGAAFGVRTGSDSDFNIPGVSLYSNRTLFDAVGTLDFADHFNYLVEALYGLQHETEGFNAFDTTVAEWYGINQQLLYSLDDQWAMGLRLEWFDDPQGYLITGLRPGNADSEFRFPGSFFETSLGVNYKPVGNVTLRGEIRYDWYQGQGAYSSPAIPDPPFEPYVDSGKTSQVLLGLDAVCQL